MVFDDQRLLRQLRLGDRDAYIKVAERFKAEIWAYIYRLCGDRELAADICQETAIAIWRAAPEFMGIKALRSWVYRVAHNIYVDYRRKAGPRVISLDEMTHDVPAPCEHNSITTLAAKQSVARALRQLPEDLRLAIVLTKIQGLSSREAADVLQVPVGTLKWRVAHGLKALRERMTEDSDEW